VTLRRTLDLLASRIERASSVPLSASCLVNRAELLSLVERARAELSDEVGEASHVIAHRDDLLDGAQREAVELVEGARRQAGELVAGHVIVSGAQARADQILDAARAEAARLLRDADEYCDRKLAGFEDDLWSALGQVRRGRHRLQDRSGLERSPDAPRKQDATDLYADPDPYGMPPGDAEPAAGEPAAGEPAAGGPGPKQPPAWDAVGRRVVDVANAERQEDAAAGTSPGLGSRASLQ
jgi:cell division septum initiation protein DivIVA